MISSGLLAEAEALLEACRHEGVRLVTAESCTGGLIAGVLTAIAGSSDVVERGFVTYSNAAKAEMLGVPVGLIASAGAVSAEVAAAMAVGALERSHAEVAIAVTGVAGPGGGTAAKPVGLVWFGLAGRGPVATESLIFPGDRTAVRMATVAHAFGLIRSRL
ncbi:MAG TPA: nicotinamide-nucleotide amidohydrolase family protein [Acidisphaera sp.]|nr:nicotinamide-nucleotide amidohydrolase family protein [Acidisphaera sp.]